MEPSAAECGEPAVEVCQQLSGDGIVPVSVSDTVEKPLSKRQQKLLKQRELWLSHKAERRLQRKEKRKEKRREKVENGVDVGPTRKMLKKNTMKDSTCHVSVVVDLSFDDLMSDKDINKLGQQLQFCYSSNRRASQPLQFYLTSLNIGGKTQQRLDRIGDYRGWDINVKHESYDTVFEQDRIIYLTSDSPNVLETLDPLFVYVIGGLVDHNHYKGLCYNLAMKRNINHARLPIDTYLQLNTRRVLAINHVFEILLRFTETGSWKDAFYSAIPKRKQFGNWRDRRSAGTDPDAALPKSDSCTPCDSHAVAVNSSSQSDKLSQEITIKDDCVKSEADSKVKLEKEEVKSGLSDSRTSDLSVDSGLKLKVETSTY